MACKGLGLLYADDLSRLTVRNLLVHGLRDPAHDSKRDWRELLTSVFCGAWPTPTPFDNTVQAEAGFSIVGNPYYFYVMRTHEAFDKAIFLLEETSEVESEADTPQMGATPFDSGGLWHGLIHPLVGGSTPPMIQARRRLFRLRDVSLDRWQPEFDSYIAANYEKPIDYVIGKPPRWGTPPIIGTTPPNEERAWTWEVRYPSELIQSYLRLHYVCMHPDDRTTYVKWLPSRLPNRDAMRLTDWIESNVETSYNPSEHVETMLLRLVA